MKISIQIPATSPVETFFEYLKSRAIDPIHADHTDLIADFADKFIVVELKRLANAQETITQNLEIPDQALSGLVEPYRKVKANFDSKWAKLLSGAGIPSILKDFDEEVKAELPAPDNDPLDLDPDVKKYLGLPSGSTQPAAPVDPGVAPVKRSGNGHKAKKVRDLMGDEKDTIRAEFLAVNGQIAEDVCKPILGMMQTGATIFQVTGFVTYLHSKVMSGLLKVRDGDAYIEFLKSHRKLWETYNSPKYQALRRKNSIV